MERTKNGEEKRDLAGFLGVTMAREMRLLLETDVASFLEVISQPYILAYNLMDQNKDSNIYVSYKCVKRIDMMHELHRCTFVSINRGG